MWRNILCAHGIHNNTDFHTPVEFGDHLSRLKDSKVASVLGARALAVLLCYLRKCIFNSNTCCDCHTFTPRAGVSLLYAACDCHSYTQSCYITQHTYTHYITQHTHTHITQHTHTHTTHTHTLRVQLATHSACRRAQSGWQVLSQEITTLHNTHTHTHTHVCVCTCVCV